MGHPGSGARSERVGVAPTRKRLLAVLLGSAAIGCKTADPPVMTKAPPPVSDGVRREALAPAEVERAVQGQAARFEACYRSEAMNSPKLSSYVYRLDVPPDGSAPVVHLQKASIPEQKLLEDCVTQVLRSLRFPAHTGARLEVEVPIEGAGG